MLMESQLEQSMMQMQPQEASVEEIMQKNFEEKLEYLRNANKVNYPSLAEPAEVDLREVDPSFKQMLQQNQIVIDGRPQHLRDVKQARNEIKEQRSKSIAQAKDDKKNYLDPYALYEPPSDQKL